MTEYSRIAKGKFTSTGATKTIILPFQPDYVEIMNYSAALAAPSANKVIFAKWDLNMGQGFAVEEAYNATPVLVADVVIANGISTFAAGLSLQYGPAKQVVASTKATGNFQVTAHGYSTGDIVVFEGLYQDGTTGMPQIAGIPFVITRIDANNFTINWNVNQSNYTALSASPAGSFVRKVLYPFLYVPGLDYISAITTGTTTTVTTSAPHNFVVGQEIAFRIPPEWGITEINSLPNVTIPGSPDYGYVISVTSNTVFVCDIDSSSYTAYNSNQTVANVPGLDFPQVLAVGDVNTGGLPISAGSQLYPSPSFPTFSNGAQTINGPAIQGAFVNNTNQGFIIGTGAGSNLTSSVLVGANGNIIYWRAFLHDYSSP